MTMIHSDLSRVEEALVRLDSDRPLDAYQVKQEHKAIKNFCTNMLRREGLDPVKQEVMLFDFPRKYVADVVGYPTFRYWMSMR
jgi:hypothetical protein